MQLNRELAGAPLSFFITYSIQAKEKGHNFDIILQLGIWGNKRNCLIVKLLKITSRKGQVLANVKIQEG